MSLHISRPRIWAGNAAAGEHNKQGAGWENPSPFNCSFGLWMGPFPSQGSMGTVDTYPLVQLIRTWASVVSLFTRDNQGC